MKPSAIVLGLTAATYSVEAARLHIRTHDQQQKGGNGEIICGERDPKNYQEFWWINRNACPTNTACVDEGYQWRCRDNRQPDGRLCGETINDLSNVLEVNWYDASKCDQGFTCRSEGQQSRCRRSSRKHGHKKHHAHNQHEHVTSKGKKGQLINGDKCGQMRQGSDFVVEWKKSWLCAPGHYCDKEGAEWRCRPDAQYNDQDDDEADKFPDTESADDEKPVETEALATEEPATEDPVIIIEDNEYTVSIVDTDEVTKYGNCLDEYDADEATFYLKPCESGSSCVIFHEWYAQCYPSEVKEGQWCGFQEFGEWWNAKCAEGLECRRQNEGDHDLKCVKA